MTSTSLNGTNQLALSEKAASKRFQSPAGSYKAFKLYLSTEPLRKKI